MHIPDALQLVVSAALITALIIIVLFEVKWPRKFANLACSPRGAIQEALRDPIKEYVWQLHEKCIAERKTLGRLPLSAAATAESEEHPCQVAPAR